MTTPLWCLLIAIFIPYVLTGIGGYFKTRQFGTLDNNNPRRQSAQLTDTGERAVAAQQNAWEALAVFTVAVLVNHLAGGDPATSAALAMAWVGLRILHAVAYLADWAAIRSLAFMGGIVCVVWLFFA
jgi:uncharacterized MAPEG superfamily protein